MPLTPKELLDRDRDLRRKERSTANCGPFMWAFKKLVGCPCWDLIYDGYLRWWWLRQDHKNGPMDELQARRILQQGAEWYYLLWWAVLVILYTACQHIALPY